MRASCIFLFCLVALPAQAVTYTSAQTAQVSAFLQMRSSDLASGELLDATLQGTSRAAEADLFVDETGLENAFNPTLTFQGHVRVASTDLDWAPVVGLGGQTYAMRWDHLYMEFLNDPIARQRVSGAGMSDVLAGELFGKGTFTLGTQEIPIDFSHLVLDGRMDSSQAGIQWSGKLSFAPEISRILTVTQDGIDYEGTLFLTGFAFVPEPGTGLLLGLGLVALGCRRH